MENIENVKAFIKSLDASVDQLSEKLKPIINKPLEELVGVNASTSLDTIKFYNNYLYTFISIIYSYLKTIGVTVESHPVMTELNRIKAYMKRLKDLEAKLQRKEDKHEENNEQAKKFIENTLGTNVNGGGAAQPSGLSQPAISSSNFKGKHTKFDDEADEPEFKESKDDIQLPLISKSKKIERKKTSGRVAKPKSNTKQKLNKR